MVSRIVMSFEQFFYKLWRFNEILFCLHGLTVNRSQFTRKQIPEPNRIPAKRGPLQQNKNYLTIFTCRLF